LAGLFAIALFAQKSGSDKPGFDVADFNKKFETAQWLAAYDEVAWKTSDVAMAEDRAEVAKLGEEWFCLQDARKGWHAFYGKLDSDKYNVVFHYAFDSAGKIARSSEKFDQTLLDAYARALTTARAKLKVSIPANSPSFNQYVRKNADGTFGVWLLPAFQTNRMAVFGGEAYYSITSDGSKILKEDSYFQPNFKGVKADPPREIWLNYRELEKPTLGTIFFVWYYKDYFTKIVIDNAKSTSTVIKDSSGAYIWVHVEKDEKPSATRPVT
jgi:hypothetical protein